MEETHRARHEERARSFHAITRGHSPSASTCSPTQKPSEPSPLGFYGGFITQARLMKSLAIGH